MNTPLVIGLGNDFRRDDAAGRVAARRVREFAGDAVRVIEESGEGATLMDAWRGTELVILIDAVHSGAAPGTIHRLDARVQPIPGNFEEESKGTIADGARLEVELLTEENDPQAQDIILDSVEVEE